MPGRREQPPSLQAEVRPSTPSGWRSCQGQQLDQGCWLVNGYQKSYKKRLHFYFSNFHLRAGFILDPVRGTAKRWQAATVRPGRSFGERIENGCLPMARGAEPLTDGEFLGSPATAKTTRTRIPVIIASTATAWPSPSRGPGKVIPRPPDPRTSADLVNHWF